MLDQVDRFVDERDRGLLMHQRAMILHQNGRPVDALAWFDLAEPILRKHGPDWTYAGLFLNRANALRDLGILGKGLENATRARELFAKLGRRLNQVKAQHVEALLLLDLGEVAKALAEFEEVRAQYREHAPELEAFVHGSNADALLYVGMYRQSAEHWAEAIAALRLAGDHRTAAIYEYWRAVTAFEDNQLKLATDWAKRAMNSLYAQGNEPMAFLARLLILQGEFDSETEGPDFADKVSRLCDALEQRGWTLRLKQARILAARARIRARDLEGVEVALADEESGPGYEALAEGLARHLAKAELASARGLDPIPELKAGLDQLDEYRMAFGSVEFQAGVSALGVQLSGKGLIHTTNHGSPAEMLWWSERSRAQGLRIPPVKSATEPDAREALGRLRQARQRLWDLQVQGSEGSEELERVRQLEEEIRAYDRTKPGPGEQAERIAPDAIHDLAKARDTVVVSLYEVGGDVRAILAGGDGIQHVRLMQLEAAVELERRMGADLDALGKPFRLPPRLQASVEGSLRRNASALAEGIWEPIAAYVGDRQVVIVPHSRLAWVPWPLLPQLRGRPVTVSPSAEAWWRAVHRSAATGPALVAAGPALSRAGGEIETIAGLYPGANLITADKSDPELILRALDGASVAHIAAHGHHEPDNVLFSRLDFGLGPLNAYELLGLDQPPGHVVLSSCDLGRSTVAVGNETLGFTAALLHAGTSTVVSSLGRVPDDMAAEMMIEYHRRCAAGATPAEALAAVGEHRPWHPFVAFGA
ncbi:CHAT domain-containing protein [Glycomyces sp. TRM65418]|uniref:CHAT domain-containing protein n=1 Tax=Glycomyces sp. TRM65418 TaxID=2867006 RepID=UPI001CE5F2A5|nr:CHAT domain-containing protein [Glycomyces sp. TRM65418]MCC3762849.1 CHAT domain-containing protein [Glycomyces sp. TRM65418]QZD56876.1 CHAT domain-containing protein [Glycomyces sp. TRM65418]